MAGLAQWKDVGVNFSGSNQAMQNAQQGFAQTQAASGGILDRITKEEQIKQDQANKAIEQQRLADVLALQQTEAGNMKTFREGQLAQGDKKIAIDKLQQQATADYQKGVLDNDAIKVKQALAQTQSLEAQRKALIDEKTRESIGNQYLALKANGATKEELAAFTASHPNFGLTAQQATVLNPSGSHSKSEVMFDKEGNGVFVPQGGEIPKGYVTESVWKNKYGSDGKTLASGMYKDIGALGNSDEVLKAVEDAKKAGIPDKDISEHLYANGLGSKSGGIWTGDPGARDINVNGLKAMIEAKKGSKQTLANIKDGSTPATAGTTVPTLRGQTLKLTPSSEDVLINYGYN